MIDIYTSKSLLKIDNGKIANRRKLSHFYLLDFYLSYLDVFTINVYIFVCLLLDVSEREHNVRNSRYADQSFNNGAFIVYCNSSSDDTYEMNLFA